MNSSFNQNKYFEDLRFMLLFPLFFLLLAVVFEYSGFDIWWVSHFYDPVKGVFPFQSDWFFNTVIHKGGRWLDKIILLLWLICFVYACFKKSHRKYLKIMFYFLIASAAGPLIVGLLKASTHIQTPSHIALFNGEYPYVRLFDHVPVGVPVGNAFPAGHASGGYCLLSIYFVLHHFRYEKRIVGLVPGILTGLIFGVSQQIRGMHFPSHDLVTITVCWYSALFIYLIFYPRQFGFLLKKKNQTLIAAKV